eukprot:CAMPEP_0167827080 /NCGR_PEP_ID=MMETSP0112_2-20121227/10470_1 /TAXON_ID=91324 /ORGANISM="Lotharella globosa, Strain CCCM811" /LENGTH=112 /DNA_ID=CAMNT_0007729753 /DNA_START=47 /DNA_END=385 /DNA_ORIENTATION=-
MSVEQAWEKAVAQVLRGHLTGEARGRVVGGREVLVQDHAQQAHHRDPHSLPLAADVQRDVQYVLGESERTQGEEGKQHHHRRYIYRSLVRARRRPRKVFSGHSQAPHQVFRA